MQSIMWISEISGCSDCGENIAQKAILRNMKHDRLCKTNQSARYPSQPCGNMLIYGGEQRDNQKLRYFKMIRHKKRLNEMTLNNGHL